jgi:hypothetical protein
MAWALAADWALAKARAAVTREAVTRAAVRRVRARENGLFTGNVG